MAFLDRITTSSATCLGFIPLRAGTLILLWLNLIMAVLMSTQSTKLILMMSYVEGYVNKESRCALSQINFPHYVNCNGTKNDILDGEYHHGNYNKLADLIKTFSLLILILALLSGICTLLGFYGVRFNRRPSFLQPFIYFGVVETGIYALIITGGIVAYFFDSYLMPYDVPYIVFAIFIQLCFLALKWHFVSVVYRYHEQWKADLKPNYQYGNADVAYCPNTIP